MSSKISKHIYLDVDESVSALFDTILLDLEVEVSHSFSNEEKYDFVFTQNVEFSINSDAHIILITDSSDVLRSSFLSAESLSNKIVQKSIRRLLGDISSVNLERDFIPEQAKSFKITSKNSFGFYLDYILTFAIKYGFDAQVLSTDYIKICTELILKEEKIPLNLDLFVNHESFIIQFSIDSLDLDFENISGAVSCLEASLFDCYKINESRVSALGCYYIKDIKTKSRLVHLNNLKNGFDNKVYRSFDEFVDYKKEEIKPGALVATSSLAIIKKIVNFLVNISDFQNKEFEDLINLYPEKEVVKGLNQEDLDFIKKILGDKNLLETMNISIKGHEDELYETPDLASKIARAIQTIDVFQIKSILGEEEFITRISGVTEDLTQENQVVSGRFDEDESFQRIEGSPEDLTEAVTRISGSKEDLSKGKWQVKRLALGEKLEEQLGRLIASENISKELLEERIEDVISEVLGTTDKKVVEKIKSTLLESAATEDLALKISNETTTENIFLQLENDKYRGQIARKNDQLLRMKKIMDSMKDEFLARKKAEGDINHKLKNSNNLNSEQKLDSANIQLDALMRENRIKETRIEQLEKANLHTIKNKDQRIMQLEERIADLVNAPSVEQNEDMSLKVSELEHVNKQFENQLVVAEGRIQTLSKKLDAELKNKAQINSTGTELSKILDEEKRKNIQLSKQVEALTISLNSAKESNEVDESKIKIKELEVSLKEAQLDNKKFEQKMKFMTSQMTELDKKLKRATGTNTSANGSTVNDKKMKQLELALDKMNTLKLKAEDELLKRKEEAHKLKQENNVLQHKIDELDRKLLKFEKKAA